MFRYNFRVFFFSMAQCTKLFGKHMKEQELLIMNCLWVSVSLTSKVYDG